MPPVVDPEIKEPKPQLVTPVHQEPELFAAEIEMEKKSSSLLPMLLILMLIGVVGGTIYYFVKTSQAKLTEPVATTAINQILKSQGGGKINFSVGTIVASVNEKPMDPHYKMLSKAGIVTTKPKSWNSIFATMTPAGEKLLSEINGVEKSKNSDGNMMYRVPLAERKLVSIDNITMLKPHLARVQYTWKWDPNRLGKEFDASGPLVQTFSTWDRGTLIKSYGVDFYGAAPTRASIVLMETKDNVWKPYVE